MGFEPATYGFQIRHSNHSAMLPPYELSTTAITAAISYTLVTDNTLLNYTVGNII